MAVVQLESFAGMLATYARTRLGDVHRAALLVRCTMDGTVVAAVFGNDNFVSNPSARHEVELVRRQLRESAVHELAFGLSGDGQSWALLVKADNRGFHTQAGKAFRMEMLRAYLDDAVWAAWRTATGAPGEMPPWPSFDSINGRLA